MALFTKLQDPAIQPEFWARVADNVDWTVKGTHPLAGRYHSKSDFLESAFARLAGVLPGGVKLQITHPYVDGDTTVVELHSTSTTNEGRGSPMTTVGPAASMTTSSSRYGRTWIR
jgi:hypothetical protein